MKSFASIASLLLTMVFSPVLAQQTLMLGQPDLSATRLAFVYAGDIWIANRDGSGPQRLTSNPVKESGPVFSPDGNKIAFTATYENNEDVYVIDASGGQPQRLTWHPGADVATGWTADGASVTLISARETDHGRSGQLYHAALAGGLPEKQMEARVFHGVYDVTNSRFAYLAFRPAYNGLFGGTSGWRGYRGGSTPPIMVMNLESDTVSTVSGPRSTNFNPMWLEDTLYFLSDREDDVFNIFRLDGGSVVKVSNEETWDIRAAGGHAGSIAYEAGGGLKMLDVATGSVTPINIEISPDLPQLRSQWKKAADTVQAFDLSPTGKRAVITARGEVFTVPVEDGSVRNVSGSPAQREYTAIWSPEGQQIAYIAANEEGQTLVIREQTGMGDSRSHDLGSYFYSLIDWSAGDDPHIAFQDNHLSLYLIRLSDGRISKIATGQRRDQIDASFSADGRWLAYTVEQPNFHRDLVLHEVAAGRSTTITDGMADTASPAFSPDGKYLYFAASTNSGPTQVGLNMTSQERPYRAGLYAVVLAANSESPLLPKSGDEEAEETDESDDDDEAGEEEVVTLVDLEGIAGRIVALPLAERNYGNLQVSKEGDLLYVQYVQPGATNEPPGDDASAENELLRFVLEDRESKSILSGVDGFAMSSDGEHLIISKNDGSLVTAELAEELEVEALDMSGVKLLVNPRDEWAQIFDEAWRMEKEYFYDPDMHGLDWQAVYDQYRPLVEHVGTRDDLTALIVQMIAELKVGHNRTGGGDTYRESGANAGLLGANFRISDGRHQIARIYGGESWNPFVEAPLATPGNAARNGEFILAINGIELTAEDNLFSALQGTAGQQVTLRVGPQANGTDAREIVVEPTDSERELRLWNWIEANRQAVNDATDGRVGYIYLPNTAGAGYTFFNRMFFSQLDKEALIIDERSNGGGQAANYITDVLSRQHLSGWKDRDGLVYNTPAGAMHGPKVMLIDQDAGSGGDYLPYSFRQLNIGKLIGTRTWGGLIGIAANPPLIDGGAVTVPFFRFYDADHNWTVENQGVAPDIEVALDPIATNQGRDTQLEAAISEVTSQLENFENPIPDQAPAYPTQLGQ